MQYAECLKKYYNTVDGTFYDAISNMIGKIGLSASDCFRHRNLM